MSKMTKPKPCVAREPLLHGSRPCSRPREPSSDLCDEHQKILGRHQLIDGTLYVERPDEEGEERKTEAPEGSYLFEMFGGEAPHHFTLLIKNRKMVAELIGQAANWLAEDEDEDDREAFVWSSVGKMEVER